MLIKRSNKPYLRTIRQNKSDFAQKMIGQKVSINSFIIALKREFGEGNVEENHSPSNNNKDIIDIVIYRASGFLKIFFTKSEDGFGVITSWVTK